MTSQTMLEISNPFAVHTPLGEGVAMFLYICSYLNNSVMIVKLIKTGELKHFDMNDVRVYGSQAYGESLIPNIPEGWKV